MLIGVPKGLLHQSGQGATAPYHHEAGLRKGARCVLAAGQGCWVFMRGAGLPKEVVHVFNGAGMSIQVPTHPTTTRYGIRKGLLLTRLLLHLSALRMSSARPPLALLRW